MSKARKNHYQVLGVNPDCPASEIKRAYRRLAKARHPDARDHDRTCASANEDMVSLNEAYRTLMDTTRRAEYDVKIGVKSGIGRIKLPQTSPDDEYAREKFLRSVFHPTRNSIARTIGMYARQVRLLSGDPYDEHLVSRFESYVNRLEEALSKASESLSRADTPDSLAPAVQMMRSAIANAADGLEEFRHYCRNFDYTHLSMGESLLVIAGDLLRQASALARLP